MILLRMWLSGALIGSSIALWATLKPMPVSLGVGIIFAGLALRQQAEGKGK